MASIFDIVIEQARQAHPWRIVVDVDPRELDLEDPYFQFPGRATGELEYKMVGEDLRAVGRLGADYVAECGRCLGPVHGRIEIPIDMMWLHRAPGSKEPEPAEDEILAEYYTGDVVDTAPALREAIMAELPPNPICSEECKGLCPRCGENLNEGPCKCPPEVPEPPAPALDWKAKLKNLGGGKGE